MLHDSIRLFRSVGAYYSLSLSISQSFALSSIIYPLRGLYVLYPRAIHLVVIYIPSKNDVRPSKDNPGGISNKIGKHSFAFLSSSTSTSGSRTSTPGSVTCFAIFPILQNHHFLQQYSYLSDRKLHLHFVRIHHKHLLTLCVSQDILMKDHYSQQGLLLN